MFDNKIMGDKVFVIILCPLFNSFGILRPVYITVPAHCPVYITVPAHFPVDPDLCPDFMTVQALCNRCGDYPVYRIIPAV